MAESGQVLSDTEVEFLLDRSGASGAPAIAAATPDLATATMHGDLEQINLTDIFQTLAMAKMEGLLQVRGPVAERLLFFRDGHLQILVPPRVATRRVGQRLLQAGLVTQQQLRSALVRQQKDPRRIGEILVADGILAPEQVEEIAAGQVAEDLFSLFTWSRGTFAFWKGSLTDAGLGELFAACPEFEVNSLLLEVARRADEWDSILQALGSLDEIPEHSGAEPPAAEAGLGASLWRRVDGATSYRSIAEQTTHDLFELAKTARDFVRSGSLSNIADEAMVEVARRHSREGNRPGALLVLQTLRDRPGSRDSLVVQGMAEVLQACDARRAAGELLLELAQQHEEPEQALELARQAHHLLPNDLATLSFLRTTLMAHLPADAPELEQTNLALVDELLAADRANTALEILGEVRRLGATSPGLLAREAKARQKLGDAAGAIAALLDLAEHHRSRGERARAAEAYEAVLRLDGSRKDVRKLLHRLRQSRLAGIVRSAALAIGAAMLGTSGVVYWQQQRLDQARRQAGAEIAGLLAAGDQAASAAALERWTGTLGEGDAIEDLRRQVAFAAATERARQQKTARQRLNQQLGEAADRLSAGDVRLALSSYAELYQRHDHNQEIAEVAISRFEGLLDELEAVAKGLANRLPPPPASVPDRRQVQEHREILDAACRPNLRRAARDLALACRSGELPDLLPLALRERAKELLSGHAAVVEKAAELDAAYTAALERQDLEARLDPIFKRALAAEAQFDFATARDLYQQLLDATAGNPDLRADLTQRATKNAAICHAMAAIDATTASGDAEGALRAYRELCSAYPQVPFARLVRVPMQLRTEPPGASVLVEGKILGRTPLPWVAPPEREVRLRADLPGYRPCEVTARTGEAASLTVPLFLAPSHERRLDNTVEAAPVADGQGGCFLVDRGGTLSWLPQLHREPRWSFPSGDLSGLLSSPIPHSELLWVASLDGTLRAIDATAGTARHKLGNLPTELPPVRLGNLLLLATTDQRLVAVDFDQAQVVYQLQLSSRPVLLLAGPRWAVLVAADGTAQGIPAAEPRTGWQIQLPLHGEIGGALQDQTAVLAEETGRWLALDVATGRIAWQREIPGAFPQPGIGNGKAWAASPSGLVGLPFAGGETTQWPAPGAWTGPATAIGNRLLVPNRDGTVHLLDADTGQALGRVDGGKRPPRIHALGPRGAAVALPDRRMLFFANLP